MLTPGRRNKFINSQKPKTQIAGLSVMDVKTCRNLTLELLERAYRLRESTHQGLQNPKYRTYQALCTTQNEWTIVNYVMELMRRFWYWTLGMSKRYTVTLHEAITVYNDRFHCMDGIMRALAKKKTQRNEDSYFAVKLARQRLSNYNA